MFRKLPLQPAGWVVLVVGLASLLGALILNWRELLVLAIGCGAILLVSTPFVVGRSEIRLVRRLADDRVTIGHAAVVELEAENSGSVRTARQIIGEAIDGVPVLVPLPALAPGAQRTVTWKPSTEYRGRYNLGPARITKADPCRLMQREVGQTGIDHLWVRPRVVPIPLMVGGQTKDIDGPTFDHSPAGDVAFHAVRQYRPGDDSRHVHWMATARAGEMMVRHYVDNRQPYVSVVLDTGDQAWASTAEFDQGVNVVASVAHSVLHESHPVSVHAGDQLLAGAHKRSNASMLLDDLTLVDREPGFVLGPSLPGLIAAERNTTIAVIVTGSGQPAADLRGPAAALARSVAVIIVQVGEDAADPATVAGRGVSFIAAKDVDEFAELARFNQVVA